MAKLKQKTVSGAGRSFTVELHRVKNNDPGSRAEWTYDIRDGLGRRVRGPFTQKSDAMSAFHDEVRDSEDAISGFEKREQKQSSGGGLFGQPADDPFGFSF